MLSRFCDVFLVLLITQLCSSSSKVLITVTRLRKSIHYLLPGYEGVGVSFQCKEGLSREFEFKASLGYIARLFQKEKENMPELPRKFPLTAFM